MKNKKKDRSIKGVVKRFAPEKMTFYYITIICGIISGAAAVIPYYLIWKTVSLLFENQHKADIGSYALYIFITQVIGLISGFLALLASHVMAFRVEKNIRRDMIAHFLKLPIGYFENEDSGRLRRLIDDNASKNSCFYSTYLSRHSRCKHRTVFIYYTFIYGGYTLCTAVHTWSGGRNVQFDDYNGT